MKKNVSLSILRIIFCALIVVGFYTSVIHAQDVDVDLVKQKVQEYLTEKTMFSGSLDVFDANIKNVRNLKLIELLGKSIEGDGGMYSINGDFRDLKSGDIIDVKVSIKQEDDDMMVEGVKIVGVKKKAKEIDAELAKKKFSDKEAQDAMRAYIEKMSKFGGTFGLFDEKNEKYRQLKLLKIHEKVRNFGILYISTIDFEDTDSNERVTVDMTVHNKKGMLEVKSVRIKKIRKPKTE